VILTAKGKQRGYRRHRNIITETARAWDKQIGEEKALVGASVLIHTFGRSSPFPCYTGGGVGHGRRMGKVKYTLHARSGCKAYLGSRLRV